MRIIQCLKGRKIFTARSFQSLEHAEDVEKGGFTTERTENTEKEQSVMPSADPGTIFRSYGAGKPEGITQPCPAGRGAEYNPDIFRRAG